MHEPEKRLLAGLLAALAVANLATGWSMAIAPEGSGDLLDVRAWLNSPNPYAGANAYVDYPPSGLVVLAPLKWLPNGNAAALFAALNILCWLAAAWLIVRLTAAAVSRRLQPLETLGLASLILSLVSVRNAIAAGNTQSIALLLLLTGASVMASRPLAAGLLFGAAAFKLKLLAGFGLSALSASPRRVVLLATAAAVLVALAFAAAFRFGDPVAVLQRHYVGNLLQLYFRGHQEGIGGVRTLLFDWTGSDRFSNLAYAGMFTVSLIALAWALRRTDPQRREYTSLALSLLWAGVVLPQLRYHAVFEVPAVLIVLWESRYGQIVAATWATVHATVDASWLADILVRAGLLAAPAALLAHLPGAFLSIVLVWGVVSARRCPQQSVI